MAAPVPTTEPTVITAGDSASWKRSFNDFPAPTWVLSYRFIRQPDAAGSGDDFLPITFTGTASGNDHLITLAAATTAPWSAGTYSGQGYVTSGSDRYTVWTGILTIAPNYATLSDIDPRTKARKILDFIESSIEKLAQKQVVTASIEGESLTFRTMEELQKARDYWMAITAAEEIVAAGGSRRCILARFTKPQ